MNTRSVILPAVVSFLLLAVCSSALAAEPSELTMLRQAWEQARDRAAQPVDMAYVRDLQKLLAALTQEGKLEDALVVKDESQRVVANAATVATSNAVAAAKEPARLAALRHAWMQLRSKVVGPNDAIYTKELQKLQDAWTRAGMLEEALVVKKEQDKLAGSAAPPIPTRQSNSFVGKKWTTASGSRFAFKADGTGTQANAAGKEWPLKWTHGMDEQIKVEGWNNDQPAILYFQFTKSREGVFGSDAERLDKQISVK